MPEERNDARQLSPVLENYLEIIFHQEIREGAARASSIAEAAGVSRSGSTLMKMPCSRSPSGPSRAAPTASLAPLQAPTPCLRRV